MFAETPISKSRNGMALLLALLLLVAAVLACSLGSSKKCTATLTYQGKTYTGADPHQKEKAVSNACNKYCRDDDPGYEAMYRIWFGFSRGPRCRPAFKGRSHLQERSIAGLCDDHVRQQMRRLD